MKKLVLIALVISIITGFAVYNYAKSLENRNEVKTGTVVVAIRNIPKNTVMKPEMVSLKKLPSEAIHALAVKNISDLKGRIAKENIQADEQILFPRLNDLDKSNDILSYSIPQNYRAITIKTDEISGVAGFVSKGDRIDIMADMIVGSGTEKKVVSMMIVENVEVLELGSKSTEKSKDTEQYTSITVLVAEKDILKLSYALFEGKYNITLRSILAGTNLNPQPYSP